MAIGLFLVAVLGIALLVKGLYPADLPASRDPDFIDNVFAERPRPAQPFPRSSSGSRSTLRKLALGDLEVIALRQLLESADQLAANLPDSP